MLAEVMEMRAAFELTDNLVEDLVRRVAGSGGITPDKFDTYLAEAMTELSEQIPDDE